MAKDILVSVIVPVYQVEKYLARCVDSILNQTYSRLEVILVDDGSRDASGRICDSYAAADPRVRVIHKENGGLSSALNAGIDIAQGDYLEFVDSDDWLEPEAVDILLNEAKTQGVKAVAAGRWDVSARTGEKKKGLCPPRREVISGQEMVRRIFRWENCDSSACDKLFHRSLFRAIRFPLGVACTGSCWMPDRWLWWINPSISIFTAAAALPILPCLKKTFIFPSTRPRSCHILRKTARHFCRRPAICGCVLWCTPFRVWTWHPERIGKPFRSLAGNAARHCAGSFPLFGKAPFLPQRSGSPTACWG